MAVSGSFCRVLRRLVFLLESASSLPFVLLYCRYLFCGIDSHRESIGDKEITDKEGTFSFWSFWSSGDMESGVL